MPLNHFWKLRLRHASSPSRRALSGPRYVQYVLLRSKFIDNSLENAQIYLRTKFAKTDVKIGVYKVDYNIYDRRVRSCYISLDI